MAKGTRGAPKGGWAQAAALVPIALFASAFTVQATDGSALASSSLDHSSGGVPESIVVPPNVVRDPANLPIPGIVGQGVSRDATTGQVVSGLSRNGIPSSALQAYSRAQQVLSKADPTCNLPWTLVAAIGRVESNHGRHGGNVLTSDGIARPGIFGPRLDGASTAKISDSDGGELDGDSTFDRAVGPMQFIPGTWRTVGVDGDGDGVRNPQDIDDAAMSAGVYLCSGATNLTNASDLNSAILRYNHSQSYADLVLSIAKAYGDGSWIAVADGEGESDDQGVDRADDETGRVDIPTDDETLYAKPTDRTRWDKPTPSWMPTERQTKPTKPDHAADHAAHQPAHLGTDRPADDAADQPDDEAVGPGRRPGAPDRVRHGRRHRRQHRHRAQPGPRRTARRS